MDPYLYQYGIGGVVFAVGLFFAARQGYVGFSGRGVRNLLLCLFVILFFAALQGYLQYATMQETPASPYDGGAEHVLTAAGRVRGHPLDYAIMIAYFVAILAVGTWFARRQKTTQDFFFGGRRFSWWLIAVSLIATTVGSYSFVKYSNKGFGYGLSSSQTYLNDWIWFPLLSFGWLPILYFSRVVSIPEYFGRRFDSRVRLWATVCILVYLIGYVGVNLFTMGKVLNALVGWQIPMAALLVAAISCTYVTAGGQTSVIMTDLLQGVMLLVTGAVILVLGMSHLGGLEGFWTQLPREARLAFPNFNEDPGFPAVGIFWQDAIANSAMFYFLNQGIIMRFLATKSLAESRKAALSMVVVLMTVGACVVGGGGWVARALVHSGQLPDTVAADQAFYVATEFVSRPGVFGLILAALTAALMSTVDTLITAVSAVCVNDLYKPYVRPNAADSELLRVARLCAVAVTVLGVALVPLFMMFDSIYDAHGAFTAAVTPPLVVTLLLSVFWRRFTRTAALYTLVGGLLAIGVSLFVPQVIAPFAHGVPMKEVEEGLFSGMRQYKFMRACYGITVSACIGVLVTLFTKPPPFEKQRGLVWGTLADAIRHYKGSPGTETDFHRATAMPRLGADEPAPRGEQALPCVALTKPLADRLDAGLGDLLYLSDRRWWLGGLRSTHAIVGEIDGDETKPLVTMGPQTFPLVVTPRRAEQLVVIERLY
ncbi:sodium:solute symporter [Planctomycetota bacterium]